VESEGWQMKQLRESSFRNLFMLIIANGITYTFKISGEKRYFKNPKNFPLKIIFKTKECGALVFGGNYLTCSTYATP
jgi:hypothetical protein